MCGFSHIWLRQTCSNADLNKIKLRIDDLAIQNCRSNQESSMKKKCYFNLKEHWEISSYMKILQPVYYYPLIKFRLSNHSLPIEAGRHRNIPYEERICTHCNEHCIGDEFHYLFECTALNDLRSKFVPAKFAKRPSIAKYISLWQSKSENTLRNISLFVSLIMKKIT